MCFDLACPPAKPEWTSTVEGIPGNNVGSKVVMIMSTSSRIASLIGKTSMSLQRMLNKSRLTSRSYSYPGAQRRPCSKKGHILHTLHNYQQRFDAPKLCNDSQN